jgi:hypothetical protein
MKMNSNKCYLAYNKNGGCLLAADLLDFNLMRLAQVIMQADSARATRYGDRRWNREHIQSYPLCFPGALLAKESFKLGAMRASSCLLSGSSTGSHV